MIIKENLIYKYDNIITDLECDIIFDYYKTYNYTYTFVVTDSIFITLIPTHSILCIFPLVYMCLLLFIILYFVLIHILLYI
jgi:hypothetical protein